MFKRNYPNTRLRRTRSYTWSRDLCAETNLTSKDLIYPLFVSENKDNKNNKKEPIKSMPGVFRHNIESILSEVKIAHELGIPAIALFPQTPNNLKTIDAKEAINPDNLICNTVREIKKLNLDIGVICDVALDPYISHGHDGLIINGKINNDLTIEVLSEQALIQAQAGCDIIAPSDMQDGRVRSSRVSISARVIADQLATVGVDRVLTVDIHAEQIQGFFQIPVDNIYGTPILLDYINKKIKDDMVVVSPDIGGVVRARAMAKRLGCDLAIIDKRRPKANVSEVMNIIGDVSGRHAIIADDMVDTGGTLCKAAKALKDQGAAKVSAFCVHPVLSGNALKNISESVLEQLVVLDSIPLSEEAKKIDKIKQLSLDYLLAEAIRRINNEESISLMFSDL